jgi:hypothetical protein
MKQKVGQMTCGTVMIEFDKFAAAISKCGTENAYDILWYSTPENRRHNLGLANNRYNIILNDKIHSLITQFFDEDNINIVACWYMNYHVDKIEKLGYNISYYDSDPYVCEDSDLISSNIHCADVIFDNVQFKGPIVHKFCEDTYPIGKVHKGKFILAGSNKKRLHICNPIESTQQLIEQNEIKTVFYEEEYNFQKVKYSIVAGGS